MKRIILTILFPALLSVAGVAAPLNILLFTADDLGYEVLDPQTRPKLDLTPKLDRFADQGMSFRHGHVNAAICQPSRAVLGSGRYSHTSGMMGFIHLKRDIPTVMETFRGHGYLTGILGKVNHSTPKIGFPWDFVHDYGELGAGRDPEKYHDYCAEFFARCKKEGKPFYFMVNSHDSHRPFHNPEKPMRNAAKPSKLFSPDQVKVPGYLPDAPEVRLELSWYYNSVRRLDDTFGRVMDALDEAGLADSTLVMFLSDNGSAVPFAKANCYLASTRTPWFVRWPGVVKAGALDEKHFISGVDFFPTVMDAAGLPAPGGVDGRSFLPLMKGGGQDGRDTVFTQIDYKIGGPANPMRCVQDDSHIYIFNPWSKPGANYRNANEGMCMKGMVRLAADDPAMQARVDMFRDRAVEECYDLEKDPSCVHNLAGDPDAAKTTKVLRAWLREWMAKTKDPVLPMFDARGDRAMMSGKLEKFPSKESLMPEAQITKMKEKAAARKNRKNRPNDEERRKRRQARRAAETNAKGEKNEKSPPPARNVVIILADDLGYADVGYHGCKDVATPHIDSIAAAGVSFTNGYVTAAVCGPTRAGLLSGRYQQRIGCEQNIGPFRRSPDVKLGLPLEVKTMADRFKTLGFATGCFGKWHLGGERAFDTSLFPTSRGFDEFFGFLEGAASYVDHTNKEKKYLRGTAVLDGEPDYYTRALGREAVSFIDRHKDERFLLYLPFNAVHAPMQADPKDLKRVAGIADPNRRKLAAMLTSMDDEIGRVLEKLREHGLERNTLVVFFSDNGGKPGNNFSLNHPLRGQKGTFYEGGIRIPFCMRWPARLPAGMVVDDPVISLDLLPTTIAAAGGRVGEDWRCEGINLLPRLNGSVKRLPERTLFWKSGPRWAVRHGDWKLLKEGKAPPRLFNLAKDISEKHDLAAEHPKQVKQLRRLWLDWEKDNIPANYGWNKALGNEVEHVER